MYAYLGHLGDTESLDSVLRTFKVVYIWAQIRGEPIYEVAVKYFDHKVNMATWQAQEYSDAHRSHKTLLAS